ncbi:MAG: universal stress protein [Solirubrobacteraceae bacterium]|nr:universal stress protein [Solirubrobacteraceae bacterium]
MATIASILPAPSPGFALDRVICALDGSPRDADATREALAVAGAANGLSFVAVDDTPQTGGAISSLGEHRARRALEQAQALAAAHGTPATTELAGPGDVAATLIDRAGRTGLLVAGGRRGSPVAAAVTGSVERALLHRAEGPLLLAHSRDGERDARLRILVAVDDGPAAAGVVALAGAVAAASDGYVNLVHVAGREYGSAMRHRLAELSIELIARTGREPVVDVLQGAHVATGITDFARRSGSSLLVVGRRGLTGLHGLGSVSGRVVNAAPCSVLVVPADFDA